MDLKSTVSRALGIAVASTAVASTLAGCTGGPSPEPSPSGTTNSASADAAQQARLESSFTACETHSPGPGDISVLQGPSGANLMPQYRQLSGDVAALPYNVTLCKLQAVRDVQATVDAADANTPFPQTRQLLDTSRQELEAHSPAQLPAYQAALKKLDALLAQGSLTVANVPAADASTMLLLPDGRLMVQGEASKNWWALTPDADGSYANGTWKQLAPMSTARLYYSSSVLKDGRVLVAGGEYTDAGQTENNTLEMYDPRANTWSPVPGPGWSMIGDAPSVVLADGRVLFGSIVNGGTAIFDPATMRWTSGGTRSAPSAEESWVLMPDKTVLTVDCDQSLQGRSQLWVPTGSGGKWVDAGPLPVRLVENDSEEIGPGLALPDGRALFVGATGHTAFYTPGSSPGTPGTWKAGPDLPTTSSGLVMGAKDAPGVLLPDGHVLVTAGPLDGTAGAYGATTQFFDLDPATETVSPVSAATLAAGAAKLARRYTYHQAPADYLAPPDSGHPPYAGRLMVLPTGEVAYADGESQLAFLGRAGGTVAAAVPTLTDTPASLSPGQSATIFGRGFNGLSQTVGYGDDASMATNYPLARLTGADGTVTYLPTDNFSTMGIATGNQPVSARITVPTDVAPGSYQLQVVANGIASAGVPIEIGSAPARLRPS